LQAIKGQSIARLLIVVLKGLGGASQEDQQPALVFIKGIKKALGLRFQRFFIPGHLLVDVAWFTVSNP